MALREVFAQVPMFAGPVLTLLPGARNGSYLLRAGTPNFESCYCKWSSSHGYVLTRGWNRFVKDKKLKANDMLSLCALCEYRENGKATQSFYMISQVQWKRGCRFSLANVWLHWYFPRPSHD